MKDLILIYVNIDFIFYHIILPSPFFMNRPRMCLQLVILIVY